MGSLPPRRVVAKIDGSPLSFLRTVKDAKGGLEYLSWTEVRVMGSLSPRRVEAMIDGSPP